ncbi:hypothetical protein LKO27_03635 [Tessaracoccus sp. OS52]|uniref:hypothetical protein n=1 Tax=Tessaracoccus sp. OS52 TaxID=2886691 RepID=UPI001D1027AA|nr:hypothetical protein [Tessaracoccus sp. OS52]MCC2592512.1 hypothetical protein [Tessaracoccus sp. OS52]
MSLHSQHRIADDRASHTETHTQAGTPAEHRHSSHGGHKWHMLLMCLPLVAIGLWSLFSGGGGRGLLVGLACMAMMMVMHKFMGSGHRH